MFKKSVAPVLFFSLFLFAQHAKAQTWDSVGTGMNGRVEVLFVDTVNNILYAGGSFTTAGGVSANRIAKWDGISWSALGTGMDNAVYALTVYNDTLYAGGVFFIAGGISAAYIAKWDGTNWSAVGGSIDDGEVRALAVYNDTLYVGGIFTATQSGVTALGGIAKWDGSNWSSVGTGTNFGVFSLIVHDTVLYVGGFFTTADGVSAINIAQWNGISLDSVASGLGVPFADYVTTVNSFNGEVYAGGIFSVTGAESISPNIARWDGTSWDSVGTGMNAQVDASTIYNNQLYAGGQFTTAGGVAVNYIAKWDGISWDSLGAGMNGRVYSLTEFNGDLYAGGQFTTAGGISANNIARWSTGAPPPCASSFTSSATTICEGETINFTNTSAGAITYEWQENSIPFSTATDTSRIFGTAGTYTISLIADSGSCSDSSGVIITVNPTYSISDPAIAICDGSSTMIYGISRSAAGTYYDSLSTGAGCDSVHSTVLTLDPTYGIVDAPVSVCDGSSILIYGISRSVAGTYYDSLLTGPGCDSVHSTVLTLDPTYGIVDAPVSVCDGSSTMIYGISRSVAGTYYDSLLTGPGCDSVHSTVLTLDPTYSINTPDDTICDGDSAMIFSVYRKIAGTYYDSLTTTSGCDSVIATTLIVNPLPVISVIPSPGGVCNYGDTVMLIASGASTYAWSPATGLDTVAGATVNASPGSAQTYTVVGTSSAGCVDSTTVDVQLSAGSPMPSFTSDITVCEGGSVLYNNTSTDAISFAWVFTGGTTADTSLQNPTVTYSTAGTYDVSLTAYGCSVDSTLTMTGYITVSPTVASTDAASICSNDSIYLGGSYTNVAGSYVDTLATVDGCDSVVTTTLTVETAVSAGISDSTDVCNSSFAPLDLITLLGGTPDGSGTWNDDDGSGLTMFFGNLIIFQATAGTYNFTYSVTGTSPCADDSATVTINIYAAPTAGTGGTLSACVQATSVDVSTGLGGVPDTNGVWTDDDTSGALTGTIFNPFLAGLGTWNFTYTVPSNPGCAAATATVAITVVTTPNAGTSGSLTSCVSDIVLIDLMTGLGGTPDANGTWNDDDGSGGLVLGQFSPLLAGTGTFNFTYTASATGCTDATAVVTMTVVAAPDAGSDGTINVCDTTTSVDVFTGLGGTPGTGGTWTDDDFTGALSGSIFDVSAAGIGMYKFTYTVTGAPCSPATATVTVDVSNCVGITEAAISMFTLYPNPSEGRFTLDFGSNGNGDTRIEVYNATGELLEEINIENNASKIYIDLTGNPNGLYYINVIRDGKLVTNKVSITK